jgi:hypothetical protein
MLMSNNIYVVIENNCYLDLRGQVSCDSLTSKTMSSKSIGCSFKFILKVDVEESIVNAPLVSLQSKKGKQRKK